MCIYGNLRGCLRHVNAIYLMDENQKACKSFFEITSRHVSIFVPAGDFILSSVIGSYKVLTTVNSLVQEQHPGAPPPFMVELVGLTKETNLYGGAFNIRPHTTIDEIDKTDIIIIPAISGDYATEIKRNQPVLSWITKQYKQGAEIASLCTGAFYIGSDGFAERKKNSHALDRF